jgi:hypothetical protein
VAIGDVSGDGLPDLVTADTGSNGVSVLLGNGVGQFQARVGFGTGLRPYSVAIGDVSGDGQTDLVTANVFANTVSVLRNITEPTTAVALATLSAEATAERVRIEWYAQGDRIAATSVHRRTLETGWVLQGHPAPDGNRRIVYEDKDVTPGIRYGYRLVVRDVTGYESTIETWVTVPQGQGAPRAVRLEPVRPNPFGGRGELIFGLPAAGRARLTVYDLQGRLVAVVLDRVEPGGWRSVVWDGRNSAGRPVASGAYFARLEVGSTVEVRKIVVAR